MVTNHYRMMSRYHYQSSDASMQYTFICVTIRIACEAANFLIRAAPAAKSMMEDFTA